MSTVTLPDDVIEQVLLRSVVKLVLRFKCVCKSWCSYISDSHFAKFHFDFGTAPTHRLLRLNYENYTAISLDTEAPFFDDARKLVYKIPGLSNPSHYRRKVHILGSCRGFILLQTNFSRNSILFMIWNPTTGLRKQISYDNSLRYSLGLVLCGVVYASSEDDYVVVAVIVLQQRIVINCFSLRTNSWSVYEDALPDNYLLSYTYFGCMSVLLNEVVHWLVISGNGNRYAIVAFDIKDKKISYIPLSHDLVVQIKRFAFPFLFPLRVFDGCLSVSFQSHDKIEIWSMKEYKVQSSWTKTFVLSTRPGVFYPIFSTQNGHVLGWNRDEQIARYDEKGELLQVRRYEHHHHNYFLADCIVYTETFLPFPTNPESNQVKMENSITPNLH
ncbi:unnamed protein product [Sphenostylis stenocarpa]|uniref:F-box domain-containing protein n=1 Tax=Sphenostylis stenocarpa TaxID=92480 RepID=A0AA86VJ09_9FABA|nr:unnamed protein product [Sphenostylis stenocarpa]